MCVPALSTENFTVRYENPHKEMAREILADQFKMKCGAFLRVPKPFFGVLNVKMLAINLQLNLMS